MAETTFRNLRVKGTLAVVGVLTAGVFAVTTLTGTTGNFTTVNVQTLSGATIKNTAGTFTVDVTDIESTLTYSGSIVRAKSSFTGATLKVTPTTGSAAVTIYGGAKGSHICIFDTDGGGWTEIDALNGTVTARTTTTQCP